MICSVLNCFLPIFLRPSTQYSKITCGSVFGGQVTLRNLNDFSYQLSLLQKCLSAEIPSIYHRESGGTGFPACADRGLNLKDIILIFFNKEHPGKLRVINAAPTFNTHLHRLESLCHQPKMTFARGSIGRQICLLLATRSGSGKGPTVSLISASGVFPGQITDSGVLTLSAATLGGNFALQFHFFLINRGLKPLGGRPPGSGGREVCPGDLRAFQPRLRAD